jgi:hypothetical protein
MIHLVHLLLVPNGVRRLLRWIISFGCVCLVVSVFWNNKLHAETINQFIGWPLTDIPFKEYDSGDLVATWNSNDGHPQWNNSFWPIRQPDITANGYTPVCVWSLSDTNPGWPTTYKNKVTATDSAGWSPSGWIGRQDLSSPIFGPPIYSLYFDAPYNSYGRQGPPNPQIVSFVGRQSIGLDNNLSPGVTGLTTNTFCDISNVSWTTRLSADKFPYYWGIAGNSSELSSATGFKAYHAASELTTITVANDKIQSIGQTVGTGSSLSSNVTQLLQIGRASCRERV